MYLRCRFPFYYPARSRRFKKVLRSTTRTYPKRVFQGMDSHGSYRDLRLVAGQYRVYCCVISFVVYFAMCPLGERKPRAIGFVL